MTNPYQTPTATYETISDQGRVWIALIPYFVAVAAVVVAIATSVVRPFAREVEVVVIGVLGAVLIFDVPVCAYVFVKWLRAGAPPDLIAELMECTPEEREFHRNLRQRPKLDDNAFYDAFYSQSGISPHFVVQLRQLLEDVTGYDMAGLHPEDDLALIDDEMDFADVLHRVERDFLTKLDWDEFRHSNGRVTFDMLLRATVRFSAINGAGTRRQSCARDG